MDDASATHAETATAVPSTFAEMPHVHAHVAIALERAGLTTPFPIQQLVVPAAADGQDLLVTSPTGSGKTLAFGLPIIHQLERRTSRPHALVLVPTRELARQVSQDLVPVAWSKQLKCAPVFGGAAVNKQVAQAAGSAIVVATPGRLADLMAEGRIDLRAVQILVLDEADRMLDMGFQPQVDIIVGQLPARRQTMLFTATLGAKVRRIAEAYTHDPVTIEDSVVPGDGGAIEHRFVSATARTKAALLLEVLDDPSRGRAVVFVATQRMADALTTHLREYGHRATTIHGAMSQGERTRENKHFKNGTCDVLVATDIYSRGMDNAAITHVVNFDPPEDVDAYLHRVGRTGRAGRSGIAISLVEQGKQRTRMQLIAHEAGITGDSIDAPMHVEIQHRDVVPVELRYTDPEPDRPERFSTRNHRALREREGHTTTRDTRPVDFKRALPSTRRTAAADRTAPGAEQRPHKTLRPGYVAEGRISAYDDTKGFGFIKPAAGGKDLFFHRRTVDGRKDLLLRTGTRVTFKVGAPGPKGHRVDSVQVVGSSGGGAPLHKARKR